MTTYLEAAVVYLSGGLLFIGALFDAASAGFAMCASKAKRRTISLSSIDEQVPLFVSDTNKQSIALD